MTLDILTSICLVGIGVILVFDLKSAIARIDRRTRRLELCIDLLLERLEVDAPFQLSERIKQIALDPRRKIEAIRLYEEEIGVSLKEAVDAINAFIAQNNSSTDQLSERIKQIALDPRRKIEAVRLYREETGGTLKEAVDAINTFIAQNK